MEVLVGWTSSSLNVPRTVMLGSYDGFCTVSSASALAASIGVCVNSVATGVKHGNYPNARGLALIALFLQVTNSVGRGRCAAEAQSM